MCGVTMVDHQHMPAVKRVRGGSGVAFTALCPACRTGYALWLVPRPGGGYAEKFQVFGADTADPPGRPDPVVTVWALKRREKALAELESAGYVIARGVPDIGGYHQQRPATVTAAVSILFVTGLMQVAAVVAVLSQFGNSGTSFAARYTWSVPTALHAVGLICLAAANLYRIEDAVPATWAGGIGFLLCCGGGGYLVHVMDGEPAWFHSAWIVMTIIDVFGWGSSLALLSTPSAQSFSR
jgi:hypothetical protein